MKNKITIQRKQGLQLIKLRGGRNSDIIKDQSKYNRKIKHKEKYEI